MCLAKFVKGFNAELGRQAAKTFLIRLNINLNNGILRTNSTRIVITGSWPIYLPITTFSNGAHKHT